MPFNHSNAGSVCISTEIWVNFGSGNGLLPNGIHYMNQYWLIYHQLSPMGVNELTIIGLDNGLSPGWRQAII